jgi:hypothetical protein
MPDTNQNIDSENSWPRSNEVIDVRYPRWMSNIGVAISLFCLAMIFVMMEVTLPTNQQVGRELILCSYGQWILCGTMSYLLRRMTIIRIDANGVAANRKSYSLTAKLVPWSEIASCEFVEVRGLGPWPLTVVPVPRDAEGKALFANLGNLRAASKSDRRRVEQAFKSRFQNAAGQPGEETG